MFFFVIDRAFGRSRIWAVARHMIAEGLRMKIAVIFIAVLLFVLPVMPFTLAGDGVTLTSRVQSFLTYSLTLAGVLLSLLLLLPARRSRARSARSRSG